MKKIFIFIFIFFGFSGLAQRIANLNVFLAGSSVGVKFTVSKGTSCNGYIIWHSADSVNFTQVYNYPGICGNTATDENISFLHSNPIINVNNYYKVDLVPIETSTIKRIFVAEILNSSLIIYPNPVITISDMLTARIYSANNTKVTGFIFNQKGNLIKEIDLTTQFDLLTIGVAELNNGLYLLKLNDGQRSYSSKFIINR
jgi:hypothetical protein